MTQTWTRPLLVLLFFSSLAGAAGALGAALFRETLHGLEIQLLGWDLLGPNLSLERAASLMPWWQRLLFPAVGGLIAGLALYAGDRHLHDGQPTDYLEAVRVGSGAISTRGTLVRAFSSLWSVATGGSLGREGSMVQVSAMLGSRVGAWFHPSDRHTLVASAAAAGLATAYDAPLASALFVAEIGLGNIRMGKLAPILLASVVGNEIARLAFGARPIFAAPDLAIDPWWCLLVGLICGVSAGALAPLYLKLLRAARATFRGPVWGRMALGGLLVGLISLAQPRVWGNGYTAINMLLHDPWARGTVLLLLVAKALATAATTGSGAVGGVFTPTLLIGACLGYVTGSPLVDPHAGAVLGMGALLAATTHAPVTAILMVLEMTGNPSLTLPLAAACVISYVTAQSLGSDSIYGDPTEDQTSFREDE